MAQGALNVLRFGGYRALTKTIFAPDVAVCRLILITKSNNRSTYFSHYPKCVQCSRSFSSEVSKDKKLTEVKEDDKDNKPDLQALDWVEQEAEKSVAVKMGENKENEDQVLAPEDLARYEFYKERKRRKEILRMNEAEYADTTLSSTVPRKSLQETSEGPDTSGNGFFDSSIFAFMTSKTQREFLTWAQQDIDWRPESWRRWHVEKLVEHEIKLQKYNAKRNDVLGNELAAAHFFVYRKCPVKFLGGRDWVTKYRVDEEEGKNEDDLPYMQFDLCNLPTRYDPQYILEAVDASNFPDLRYEGLENLANLKHVKYLKLAGCEHIDAWCIDRIACYFEHSIRYLDLSGCVGLTEGALCALARFRNLETLVVKDMPQITNREIVFAMLEDLNPKLKIIGNNYETKLKELIQENEMLEKKSLEIEAETITIEPKYGAGPDPVCEEEGDGETKNASVRQMQGSNV